MAAEDAKAAHLPEYELRCHNVGLERVMHFPITHCFQRLLFSRSLSRSIEKKHLKSIVWFKVHNTL
jgi:hypothetical protein